jgi:hypothetical protein
MKQMKQDLAKQSLLFGEQPLQDVINLARLLWVVLQQISQNDVGIETNHNEGSCR